jgi:hypothetical protein
MSEPKRTYSNAGMQTQQGFNDFDRYRAADASEYFPLKTISLVLGIRLQKISLIPVNRHLIDKRAYYRKGDIEAWIGEELKSPDGLLAQLRAEHAKTRARMRKQPSRYYVSGQLGKAQQPKKKNKKEGASSVALNWISPEAFKKKE